MGRHRLFLSNEQIDAYARQIRSLGGEVTLSTLRERHRMKTGRAVSKDRFSEALNQLGWRHVVDMQQFMPPEYKDPWE
jgi:hypothetical protein